MPFLAGNGTYGTVVTKGGSIIMNAYTPVGGAAMVDFARGYTAALRDRFSADRITDSDVVFGTHPAHREFYVSVDYIKFGCTKHHRTPKHFSERPQNWVVWFHVRPITFFDEADTWYTNGGKCENSVVEAGNPDWSPVPELLAVYRQVKLTHVYVGMDNAHYSVHVAFEGVDPLTELGPCGRCKSGDGAADARK